MPKRAVPRKNQIIVEQRQFTSIRTWHDLKMEDDHIEKLVFPMEIDDEYDRGKINELKSQVQPFQGSLSQLN